MFFQTKPEVIGLDISERSIKAVQLSKNLHGAWKLKAISDIVLAEGAIKDGRIIDVKHVSQAIEKLISHPKIGRFSTRYTVSCLPENKTFIKMIDIPPMSSQEIGEAVKWEAEHHIPLSINETYWDWQLVNNKLSNKRIPILIGVSPKDIVNSYNRTFKQTKLTVIALEIEAEAIVRSLLTTTAGTDKNPEATMIIDFGASHTSLCVYDKETIQFTVSLPIAGTIMTEELAHNLNITSTEAEKAKVIYGLDTTRGDGIIRKLLLPTFEQLSKKILDTVDFYKEHFKDTRKINKIILCGGGANLKSLDSFLMRELNIKTFKGDPWIKITSSPAPYKRSILSSYTTAIGLALRPFTVNYDQS